MVNWRLGDSYVYVIPRYYYYYYYYYYYRSAWSSGQYGYIFYNHLYIYMQAVSDKKIP